MLQSLNNLTFIFSVSSLSILCKLYLAFLKFSIAIIDFSLILSLLFTDTFSQFKNVPFHFSANNILSINGSYITQAIGCHLYTNANENVQIGNPEENGIVQSTGSHTHT
jgi:hypothetical protein